MKTIASNDIMEILKTLPGEAAGLVTHGKQMQDWRCDMAFRLLQSWGAMAAMGDILTKYAGECGDPEHKHVPSKPVPPSELVIRICEVVDAAWNEMRHRGWIIDVGSLE